MKSEKLKKIIGLGLAFSAATTLAPSALSLNTVRAEASDSYLKDIDVDVVDGSSDITLYDDDDYKSKNKISSGDSYPSTIYGHISSNKKRVTVDVDAKDGYKVRVYHGSTRIDEDDEIKIDEGDTEKFTIKVYDEDDDDYSSVKKTYTLKIERYDDDDDDDDDEDDDVYLEDIDLENNFKSIDFDFKKKTKDYDITVKNSIDYVRVIAEPEDDDDIVRVNDERVKEDDDNSDYDWRSSKIWLSEGKNVITVKVKDDDDDSRTYTLNITRKAADASTANNTNTNSNSNVTYTTVANTSGKHSQWEYANGKWVYYDVNGNLLKNSWKVEPNGKSYYLGADGVMATGWLSLNGTTYYLDPVSGEKKTGWVYLANKWYHFDNRGTLLK